MEDRAVCILRKWVVGKIWGDGERLRGGGRRATRPEYGNTKIRAGARVTVGRRWTAEYHNTGNTAQFTSLHITACRNTGIIGTGNIYDEVRIWALIFAS
jgi:hypothetical protein